MGLRNSELSLLTANTICTPRCTCTHHSHATQSIESVVSRIHSHYPLVEMKFTLGLATYPQLAACLELSEAVGVRRVERLVGDGSGDPRMVEHAFSGHALRTSSYTPTKGAVS